MTLEVALDIIKLGVDIVPPITVNTEPSNVRLLCPIALIVDAPFAVNILLGPGV